ncbi:MAG TPA: precorrin-4 C(11)-methyltransferase [Candidatus Scatomonas merdigallinarum]|nr:precorrin-4 C(11)-methyltransferase [Candidatus Scatomonas merdigallinarum]
MIHFVGAGAGAPDLITLRGKKFLEEADVIIYAGSLVNPQLLDYKKEGCRVYNSAKMTLEEVLQVMEEAEDEGLVTVRLHTGDPCLYGAIREQMDVLDEKGIGYDYCPGVSSFCGAASALNLEYTLPEVSQSVVITRMAGRTPVPEKESIESFAAHQATMVVFLSTGMLEELSRRLIAGGYQADTPAAIVYKATWEDEKACVCTVGTLAETAKRENITKTALMIIGDIVTHSHYDRSKLYHPEFTTEFRQGTKQD